MGMGMVPGSEQEETMRTFVRIQLGSEHLREFANQCARVAAITTGMNDLAKEDELKPGCLTLDQVKSKVLWAWR